MALRPPLQLIACALLLLPLWAGTLKAQTLEFVTVERPPFAMGTEAQTGFSIDLMRMMAEQIGREVRFETVPAFGEMLARVASGAVDGAIANISITAAREAQMDFTLPVFESGVQLMVSGSDRTPLWQQVFTRDIAIYLGVAIAMLCAAGFFMWLFERRHQPYFEKPAREAFFPSFWWALNLVVNGGFEERQPRSIPGRLLATVMVFSSLFVVSIFVAKITAAITVNELTASVSGLNDLDGRAVGSVAGSTASDFLDTRAVAHSAYPGLAEMIAAFEAEEVSVVVYDGPLLRYYLSQNRDGEAYLVETVFRREDYGIALPTGSPLREPLNQALLQLQEDGQYNALVRKWFGG
ncbi:transporter substrate-binding domain-containing protein [Marinovum sp.]|uniref:transporter substrate-binding domain-containing protein n=1 Tax=Marinovum sp. TaxID=2024839 RepID=UPI002B2798FD|nr:transporter substrate-binding domain-containing protein [Marinovum sp.]